mgnify:CR=1 FL=1
MAYRGYLTSRPLLHGRTPQHIQNIVIRNYCLKNDLDYLLSVAEVAMEDGYFMLEQLLNELSNYSGIVFFSIFQLPSNVWSRKRIFEAMIGQNLSMHFAAEELYCATLSDVARVEDIYLVAHVIEQALSSRKLKAVVQDAEMSVTGKA